MSATRSLFDPTTLAKYGRLSLVARNAVEHDVAKLPRARLHDLAFPDFHVRRTEAGHEIGNFKDAVIGRLVRAGIVQAVEERVDLGLRDSLLLVMAQ